MTSDEALAARILMIANHGQECKYHHRRIGCNSRLDTLQAAVLDVKLKHLEEFTEAAGRLPASTMKPYLPAIRWLSLRNRHFRLMCITNIRFR